MKPLTKWNPIGEMSTLHHEMDNLFKRFFEIGGEWMPDLLKARVFPALEAFYKEGKFVVKAELPGIDPKDVDISVIGSKLTIRGERKEEKDVRDDAYIMMERSHGSFMRSITLPEGVDTTMVHAAYHDGVLDITMPCSVAMAPRQVPIEIGDSKEKIIKKVA